MPPPPLEYAQIDKMSLIPLFIHLVHIALEKVLIFQNILDILTIHILICTYIHRHRQFFSTNINHSKLEWQCAMHHRLGYLTYVCTLPLDSPPLLLFATPFDSQSILPMYMWVVSMGFYRWKNCPPYTQKFKGENTSFYRNDLTISCIREKLYIRFLGLLPLETRGSFLISPSKL